jgi:myo-inositol-1(or 4)-monophosphatase
MQEYMDFAKQLAVQAGDIMLHYFDMEMDHKEKADKTIVTQADEEINELVIQEVSTKFPAHAVMGEEASTEHISKHLWVCDPIDGTVPFSKGLPVAVFSLALCVDGESKVGVVYDPFMKRLYSAIKGEGAFLNDEPIKVSDRGLKRRTTINIEWWPDSTYDVDTAMHNLSIETKAYVLHLGSITHAACLVASGKYEAALFPANEPLKNVDIAAVKVIVEEAGGIVTNIKGKEQRYDTTIDGAIISNGIVHQQILEALNR